MQPATIFLDFCDLGRRESKTDHWLLPILRERFDVRVTTSPDFIVYGDAGDVHRMYTCKKVYLGTNEPPGSKWDYAVSFGSSKNETRKPTRHLTIGSTPLSDIDKARMLGFFETIFADGSPPVAAKKRVFGRWMLVRKNPITL
jgi:hypothetical protein